VIASQHLTTWAIHGDHLSELQEELRKRPGVEQTVTFGDVLHVSGSDAELLQRTVEAAASAGGRRAEPIDTNLEDVFIYLMGKTSDNDGGTA
jgi:ABC-2 type transport system ATP-binding protein